MNNQVSTPQLRPETMRTIGEIRESGQPIANQAQALILLVGRAGFEQLLDRGVFPETETRQLQAVAQILRYHDPLPTSKGWLTGLLPNTLHIIGVTHSWENGVVKDLFSGSEYHTIWAPPVA